MSVKGFESLSTEHAAKLESAKRVEKMVERKELTSQAKSEFDSKATPGDAAAVARALGAKRGRPAGVKSNATASSQSSEPDPKLRQLEAITRYTRYFNSKNKQCRDACGGIPPNPRWSAEEAEAALDRVRAARAEDAGDEMFKSTIITAARGYEYVTMKMGINPAKQDLTDFGDFIETNIDELDPELSEGRAECGSLLSAPWYIRLAYKGQHLAVAFHESKKRGVTASMAPLLPSEAAIEIQKQKKARSEPDTRTSSPEHKSVPHLQPLEKRGG